MYRAKHPLFLNTFLASSLFAFSLAHAKYDIARNDFSATNFVGPVILNEAKLEDWNYADEEEDLPKLLEHQKTSLFSTLIDLSTLKVNPYKVPDILYPVVYVEKDGKIVPSDAANTMGLNLLPVGSGSPVYRVTDQHREKFGEILRDPETGREVGLFVDERTFNQIAERVADDRLTNAPLLTLADFDGTAERMGIAEEVKKELSANEEDWNESAYNALTQSLRNWIANLAAPGNYDANSIAENFESILKESGLRNRITDEELNAIIVKQRTHQSGLNGGAFFVAAIFDAVVETLKAKVALKQSEDRDLDLHALGMEMRDWCNEQYPVAEQENRRNCNRFGHAIRWDIENSLDYNYAENTISYSYERIIANRRFNEDEFWEAVWQEKESSETTNPDSIGVRVVDRLVRQSLFKDAGIDDKRNMYTIVGHTSASEAMYKSLKELTNVKSQTSIHHVSAYYGANGYTRRGFLQGGEPNNLYTVSVKGVDQEAFNLNAKIWAKLYYENPTDHYQFAEEYEFDEFENTTLRRVLDFGRGWLDKGWVNKPLNAKYLKYAEQLDMDLSEAEKAEEKNKPYYRLLQEDPVYGLYCFEGVTNQLNVALNIPLTEKYLQRIYGEEAGSKLFALANERWQKILLNEGIPGEYDEETKTFSGEVANMDLKNLSPILDRMKPLWELKGMLTRPAQFTGVNPLAPDLDEAAQPVGVAANSVRDAEYNRVGNSLAWVPQTTGDIIADLIEMYVPFHKTKAAISSTVILNFQTEHEERTGITQEKYMSYALPILSHMFKAEASLELTQVLEGAPETPLATFKAVYSAGNKEFLKKMLTKPNSTAAQVAAVAARVDALFEGGIQAGIDAAEKLTTESVQAAGGDKKYAAWLQFNVAAKEVLKVANQTPVEIVDPVLARLQEKRFVKFYTRPGLLQSMVAGSWPTNPHILLRGVGTVIKEEWTQPKVEGTRLVEYNYLESEDFVKSLAAQADQFRSTPVDNEALKAFKASLYDGKIIGDGGANADEAQQRLRMRAIR